MKLNDGFAELVAFLDVGQHVFEGARRLAEGHDGVAATLQIESLHQFAKTAGGYDQVLGRHPGILEDDIGRRDAAKAHQAFAFTERDTGPVTLDIDGADTLRPQCLG